MEHRGSSRLSREVIVQTARKPPRFNRWGFFRLQEFLYLKSMYSVYILQSSPSNIYYIGYTGGSLESRVAKHNRPHKGFTGRNQPWELVYHEEFSRKTDAIKRERELKGWKSSTRLTDLIQTESVSIPVPPSGRVASASLTVERYWLSRPREREQKLPFFRLCPDYLKCLSRIAGGSTRLSREFIVQIAGICGLFRKHLFRWYRFVLKKSPTTSPQSGCR